MPKIQIYKHVTSIRISDECYESKIYLRKCGINTDALFREGGENAVINKAKEYKFRNSSDFCPF